MIQHRFKSGEAVVETSFTQTWQLQSQTGDKDWQTHITSANPMSLTDAEPQRWQAMEMFTDHRWRVINVQVNTQTRTTIIRPKETANV